MNDRMKGMTETLPADKWKQVAGCPRDNNDDFPLSITQLTDLLAKYPKIDAVLDAGGAPQMEVKAYKELMGSTRTGSTTKIWSCCSLRLCRCRWTI